jgi:hypothetical protein
LVSGYGAVGNTDELSWLVEIARNKAGYTPDLKYIHLIDWNRRGETLWGKIWPPPGVADSLKDAGIEVKTSIRSGRS